MDNIDEFKKEIRTSLTTTNEKVVRLEENLKHLEKSVSDLPKQFKIEIEQAVQMGFSKSIAAYNEKEMQRKDQHIEKQQKYQFWLITTVLGTLITTLLTIYFSR